MTSELEKYLRKKEAQYTYGKFYCPYCMLWIPSDFFIHMAKHWEQD